MDELIDEIRDYYHNHGYYPKVKVSRIFALENHLMISELIDLIEIDETVDQWELE